jgi:polyphosphate glucokinase
MKSLVVDVGESRVKILTTGQEALREFASGPSLTAEEFVSGVLDAAGGWEFDLVSIGYPGPVLRDEPASEPLDLGPGRVGSDFKAAFGCLIKLINDFAVQAYVSYV